MIATIEKPFIAAINRLCIGGGFELPLACDLLGNAVTAIGLPETRIGIPSWRRHPALAQNFR